MSRRLTIKLPGLVGSKEYEPTGLQIQVLCAHIEAINNQQQTDPIQLLKTLGKASTNWYNWLKKDGFMNWWNGAINEYFTGHGLNEVHRAVFVNALGNSAQDRKLYLERFDREYKPATAQEHSFKGIEPPEQIPQVDTDAAVARSKLRDEQHRKRIESELANKKEAGNDAPPATPIDCTDNHRNTYNNGQMG